MLIIEAPMLMPAFDAPRKNSSFSVILAMALQHCVHKCPLPSRISINQIKTKHYFYQMYFCH